MKLGQFFKNVLLNILQIEYFLQLNEINNVNWMQQHLGSRGNYPFLHFDIKDNITAEYNIEQIQLIVRHGTRYPVQSGMQDIYKSIEKLRNKVDWIPDNDQNYVLSHTGQLNDRGQQELYWLGRRFAANYPEFIRSQLLDDQHVLQSTGIYASWSSRALQSGQAFCLGAFEGLGSLGPSKWLSVPIYSLDQYNDTLIAYLKSCPRWKKQAKKLTNSILKPIHETHLTPIARRLSKEYHLDVSVQDVLAFYSACASEVSLFQKTDTFCKIFTKEDVLVLEYMDDLKHYYKYSYGLKDINGYTACDLGKSILNNIEAVINEGNEGIRLDVKFGHTETILPFLTLLGLYKDNREFKMSSFGYFANNIMVQLLTDKEKNYYIRILQNEQAIQLVGCKSTYCSLKEFYSFIIPKLNCDFKEYCK